MKLNKYPKPQTRTLHDFGEVRFTPLDVIVPQTISYYRGHGVPGGYIHLRAEKKP